MFSIYIYFSHIFPGVRLFYRFGNILAVWFFSRLGIKSCIHFGSDFHWFPFSDVPCPLLKPPFGPSALSLRRTGPGHLPTWRGTAETHRCPVPSEGDAGWPHVGGGGWDIWAAANCGLEDFAEASFMGSFFLGDLTWLKYQYVSIIFSEFFLLAVSCQQWTAPFQANQGCKQL